ncbi:MAG TPA: hypothetical protein VLK34_10540 [Nocardioidaceae bacterium]|nr:hypothetical protein [Nocardioidaceae bacterium]
MAVCSFCGKASVPSTPDASGSADDDLPLTWATSVENGKARVYCDECARTNLRSIESKLDAEWW